MIEVEIEAAGWSDALTDPAALVREAAGRAAGDTRGEIVVLLADDARLEALNSRFLGKAGPTNVLSFPDADPERLGDVALALGVCAREAAAQGKPLADHVRHLVVHGVLHLLGYDHVGEEDATLMESLERRLLAEMNIPDPYAEAGDGRHRS